MSGTLFLDPNCSNLDGLGPDLGLVPGSKDERGVFTDPCGALLVRFYLALRTAVLPRLPSVELDGLPGAFSLLLLNEALPGAEHDEHHWQQQEIAE